MAKSDQDSAAGTMLAAVFGVGAFATVTACLLIIFMFCCLCFFCMLATSSAAVLS